MRVCVITGPWEGALQKAGDVAMLKLTGKKCDKFDVTDTISGVSHVCNLFACHIGIITRKSFHHHGTHGHVAFFGLKSQHQIGHW